VYAVSSDRLSVIDAVTNTVKAEVEKPVPASLARLFVLRPRGCTERQTDLRGEPRYLGSRRCRTLPAATRFRVPVVTPRSPAGSNRAPALRARCAAGSGSPAPLPAAAPARAPRPPRSPRRRAHPGRGRSSPGRCGPCAAPARAAGS
jgi:hypothetical protein